MARSSIPPVPAGASPAIAAIWAEYFRAYAKGNRSSATDATVGAAGEVMEAAARRLAMIPHRSVHDLAAKAQFALHVQDYSGAMSDAEHDVRVSVLAAVVAMASAQGKAA